MKCKLVCKIYFIFISINENVLHFLIVLFLVNDNNPSSKCELVCKIYYGFISVNKNVLIVLVNYNNTDDKSKQECNRQQGFLKH